MSQYRELKNSDDWRQVLEASSDRPALVFKHSTTCPISAGAWREFESYLNSGPNENADYVMVKVIESRGVSSQIANDLGIRHQSPQVILVRDRQAVWDTSHGRITARSLRKALE